MRKTAVGGSHVSLGATSGELSLEARTCGMYMSILRHGVMSWQTLEPGLVEVSRTFWIVVIALPILTAACLSGRCGHGLNLAS